MRMGLREANQQFSKAMKAVKAGKEVILTERGKPIAVIKPLEQAKGEDAIIRRLEAEGILRPALARRAGEGCRWKETPLRLDCPFDWLCRQRRGKAFGKNGRKVCQTFEGKSTCPPFSLMPAPLLRCWIGAIPGMLSV